MRAIDETGNRYERLVVLEYTESRQGGHIMWLCKCDCGKETIVSGDSLRAGATKSCGCLASELEVVQLTHGMSCTPEHKAWRGAIQRCTNPNEPNYHHYGGRGITICSQWRDSFEAFYSDMGPRPPEHTLERINNSLGYTPDNCKWATLSEQGRNTRANHHLTYNGKTQCVTAWAEELDINPSTLFGRIRQDWTTERALTQPT